VVVVTSDLTKFQGLLDVSTGEVLEPTIGNAARVLVAARAMKERVNAIVQEATEFLVEMSEHQGTKTLHGDDETITLNGGPTVDYDYGWLFEELLAAGCPQARIDAAIRTVITYRVDRSVLRQLAAANPKYRAAIERAQIEVEKPYRASVKLRRADD
jgi:hypothetical protein